MPTQPVVVAAADLQLGTALEKDDLQVVQFPQGAAPEGTFSQPTDLLGRGLIVPVVKNEPILAAKLASKEAGAGLPPGHPRGHARRFGPRQRSRRRRRLRPARATASTWSPPRARPSRAPTRPRRSCSSNVQVLTAGTRMEQDQDDNKPMQVTVVTLLVNPEQAERLALASTEGKIQLALRNPLDQGAPDTPGIRTAGLMGGKPAPAGAGAARGAAPQAGARSRRSKRPGAGACPSVEIIRGDKRSVEVIK